MITNTANIITFISPLGEQVKISKEKINRLPPIKYKESPRTPVRMKGFQKFLSVAPDIGASLNVLDPENRTSVKRSWQRKNK